MKKPSSVTAFVDDERAKGKSDAAIRHQLLDAGWHMDIIKHAMAKKPVSDDTVVKQKTTPHHKPKKGSLSSLQKYHRGRAREAIQNPYVLLVGFGVLVLMALFI